MSATPYSGFKDGVVPRTVIETLRGDYMDFVAPSPENVHVTDIAGALSKVCRFAGHVRRFYSVAEHALLVRQLVIRAGFPELGFPALHHDSEETYLGDVTTPLKALLGEAFQVIREPFDAVVGEALGIDPGLFHHPEIVKADLYALRVEAWELKRNRGQGWGLDHLPTTLPEGLAVQCLTPTRAELAFLTAHHEEAEARV